MPYNLRLIHGGAYSSDLRKIRKAIRANGTLANYEPVHVSDGLGNQVTLLLDLAYQANSALPAASASLYTLGFINNAGHTYLFNIMPRPIPPLWAGANTTILVADGSYASLGAALPPFPGISSANLTNSITTLANYAGGAGLGAAENSSLIRLIITLSEALRFADVEQGVNGAIAIPAAVYVANWNNLHNWGGHTLGQVVGSMEDLQPEYEMDLNLKVRGAFNPQQSVFDQIKL